MPAARRRAELGLSARRRRHGHARHGRHAHADGTGPGRPATRSSCCHVGRDDGGDDAAECRADDPALRDPRAAPQRAGPDGDVSASASSRSATSPSGRRSASRRPLQFALEKAALLSPTMQTTSIALAGAVLIAAGVYQWTPLKQACLRHCRSPLDFIMTHWRPGTAGAFVDGAAARRLLPGVLLAADAAAVRRRRHELRAGSRGSPLFVLVEKLAPAGRRIGQGAGVLLVVMGRRDVARRILSQTIDSWT